MSATTANHTPTEMMTIAAARGLRNEDVCFVGIGAPSAACNLARLTHAPNITLIYESGTIATRPTVLPLSIGDGELCDTALTTVSVPEMFRYWVQGGRISVGFLGGAQIDWSDLHVGQNRGRVPLPGYPFERQRYWIDARPRASGTAAAVTGLGVEGLLAAELPLREDIAGDRQAKLRVKCASMKRAWGVCNALMQQVTR